MAAIVRGTKSVGGGTNFTTGTILASEMNTDLNTIVTDYNGNIDNSNIKTTAAIETSKIDGYSVLDAERTAETSPGVTGGVSNATTLAGELERLRFKIKELGLGSSVKRLDGTAGVDLVSWIDTPQTGPNLIRNGNFAVKTTAAGSAPDAWVLVLSPTVCTVEAAGVTEGHATSRAITFTSDAANEGISQTLVGLKRNTKYVIGCRVKCAAGDTFGLTTTGASGATFGNLSLQTTSTSYVTVSGVIVTEDDAAPADVVVSLLAVGAADTVSVTHCWVRECATDRIPMGNTAWAYGEITTATANHYTPALTFVDSGITGVAVVCPGPGYVIEVVGYMDFSDDSAAAVSAIGQLRENGSAVQVAISSLTAAGTMTYTGVSFSYVNRSPTPGTTYTYTAFGTGVGAAIGRNHTAVAGEAQLTWLRCRAVLESGGW